MSAAPKLRLSPQEYLTLERRADRKSEYYHGEMFAMAANTREHILIVFNVGALLREQLRGKPCEAYQTEMRVHVSEDVYSYPDISIVCGERIFVDGVLDTLVNPTVIIEVLSTSTELYDRGKKFASYRTISSLQQYVLISQFEPLVEWHTRQPNNEWQPGEARGLDAVLELSSINCALPLAEIYDRITFKF